MTRYRRSITEEQYNNAISNDGLLTEVDKVIVFSYSERNKYGVYNPKVIQDHGKYFVTFTLKKQTSVSALKKEK